MNLIPPVSARFYLFLSNVVKLDEISALLRSVYSPMNYLTRITLIVRKKSLTLYVRKCSIFHTSNNSLGWCCKGVF